MGADGFALRDAVHATDAPAWLRQVPAVQTLRAVWIQQSDRDRQGLRWRGKGEQPPAALAIDSPHDPDARYGIKARDEAGLDLTRFDIGWDRKQVTCPTARPPATGARAAAATAYPSSRPPSAPPTAPCPDRARCTRAPTNPRHLTFRPRTEYQTQRQLRAEQATPAWQDRYAHRAGVEGTIAQATRRSDLHQTRYRGLAKTHLQHVLTALALNLVRIDAWLTGIPPGDSWVSRLTRLRPALAPV